MSYRSRAKDDLLDSGINVPLEEAVYAPVQWDTDRERGLIKSVAIGRIALGNGRNSGLVGASDTAVEWLVGRF